MKVAISLPDALFRQAESAARRLRMPRSRLYAHALELFLRQQRRPDVTERLDAVYGTAGADSLDEAWLEAGLEVLRRAEWEE
jgi:metal-responsive CopG/Arc/MetJ family transcriptional regulator